MAPEPQHSESWLRNVVKEGRPWFLTAFLVLLIVAILLVLYALKARPTEFFYVLF